MNTMINSLRRVADAALVIELHSDGTYTIKKNRFSSDMRLNQTILVSEDGLTTQVKE